MSLPFAKPNPTLLRELRAVARRAGDLERALDQANLLPEDFPKQDAVRLIVTLEALPDGTAEGCREPLRFAEHRLAEIIRDHIQIDDEEGAALGVDLPDNHDAPPVLSRGGHVEQAISLLIGAITIARSEYGRQASEVEEDEPPERAVVPDADQAAALAELDAKADEIQAETRDLKNELDNREHFNATDAVDALQRQSRDAETHIDLVRQTARQPAIRPGTLARLGGVIRKIPDAMEATGKGLQKGIDVLEPFANQWFNQIPTDIYKLVLKHLRLFADNVTAAGRTLKGKGRSAPSWAPGLIFRDVDAYWCPEMVVIPAGSFMMGSPESEKESSGNEGPQHRVNFQYPFAIGKYPVTVSEFVEFCRETGLIWAEDLNLSRGLLPIVDVSFEHAEAYLNWLSEVTGFDYRLPSEAEWEYACRAGTTTPFWTGETIFTDQANYDGRSVYGPGRQGDYRGETTSVAMFSPNPFRLCEMHGNVWEWCADTWHGNYEGAPEDGSAWLDGGSVDHAPLRGGAWVSGPASCRSAYRNALHRKNRNDRVGFRAVRTLD
ncbi:MAG: SUMF1/EgtB/PvdO family nonheme iron enzyme [Alphaproteobacteria bacterium]